MNIKVYEGAHSSSCPKGGEERSPSFDEMKKKREVGC
jgi:hypothetical protein